MKRITIIGIIIALLCLSMAGCSSFADIAEADQKKAEESGLTLHKIGVPVYNIEDEEVNMFKDYLDGYVKESFSDVTFLYSDTISNSEQLMAFLQTCAEEGVEGILAFMSYDLEKEVEFCNANGIYYVRPAGTTTDEEFEAVKKDPYYLGEIGPGKDAEYAETAKMAKVLTEKEGDAYLILSEGACMGNEMHRLRTLAILNTLADAYGISYDMSAESLAITDKVTTINRGALTLTICPGYLHMERPKQDAASLIQSGKYTTLMAAGPVSNVLYEISKTNLACGIVDCFSEENRIAFANGTLEYMIGKYPSQMGPGFAALYNAITGNGELYRVNQEAFRLVQDFWVAEDADAYEQMYGLACGTTINAYNYEDLQAMIGVFNDQADFDSFRQLTENSSYEACLARRSE